MPDVLAENRSLWAIVQLQQDNALISRQHLIKALQEYTKSEAFSYIALAITGGALFMLDQQHVERAVELYALASMNPLVANSRWYKDVAGNVIKETATETLSQVELQAARTRGQQLDLKETAVSLLQELQEWDHNKPVQPPVNAGQPIFLNRYVQGELLATGGQGTVYHGYDKATGDAVAIKRLQEAQQPQNENLIQRFIREGEALRQLNHPNIVKMLAAPEQNGEHVIIMEYVAGGSLRDLLERDGPLPINRVLSIALELADALTRAHHMGIIHRDLKPANVLLAEDGTPRLTDFGIARMSNQVTHLTQPGSFMGSPTYMSPEACRGELLDTRSDIWSFGVLLYEMLAGRPPFQEEQVTALIIAIINDPIPDLTQFCPDTPPALINLIAQMLAKEHDQRPSSVRQIAAGLENIPPLGT